MSNTVAGNPATETSIEQIAAGLNQLVADNYGLMAQLHLAHWNVEGSDFFQLHEAFQSQYEEVFGAIDDIAERVRALDCYSAGGLKNFAKMSRVEEAASESPMDSKEWVASIIAAHEVVMEGALELRKLASESGDAETEDLLIGRISSHQKTVWFLKSFLR